MRHVVCSLSLSLPAAGYLPLNQKVAQNEVPLSLPLFLAGQTDIVNFVNFVNILMMTSLARRAVRVVVVVFLVWPKCNLHVNQISSFVALPDDQDDSRELQSCHKWQLAKHSRPPLPLITLLNRNYVDVVDEAVGVCCFLSLIT